jgi:hypothetical protein
MAEPIGLPLFDMMMQENLLQSNVFAFFLSINDDEDSELLFGSYNEEKVGSEIEYHDVVYQLFWSLNLDDILVNKI